MFIVYDLVFLIVILIHLPLYLLRKKFRHGLPARIGILPKGLDFRKPVWIHAVSVGEAMMVKGLVQAQGDVSGQEVRNLHCDRYR